MTLTFKEQKRIRDLYRSGKTKAEIARIVRHDVQTVDKYIRKEDFSPADSFKSSNSGRPSKLDPFIPIIIEWLEGDLDTREKQRHTAVHIYDRLVKEVEGFNCSKTLVCNFVREKKNELKLRCQTVRLPLDHSVTESQSDFGESDFYLKKTLRTGKYLALSFPSSNAGFIQLNYGENMECLFEGLDRIFRHIGGVPKVIWFDNGSAMVQEVIYGGKSIPCEKFERFAEHYGFRAVFMNVREPQGKGNVEAKVGYARRTWLVPPPEGDSLEEINELLFEYAKDDHERNHYKKGIPLSELFEKNKEVLNPLPEKPFALYRSQTVKADKTGMVELDKKFYSTSPDFAQRRVNVKITSSQVIIMDSQMNVIVTHPRLYGEEYESKIWGPYLKAIQFKPRALPNTGIPALLGEKARVYVLSADNKERVRTMRILYAMSEEFGFDQALKDFSECFEADSEGPVSQKLQKLFEKYYPDEEVSLPDSDEESMSDADFSIYDRVLNIRKKEEDKESQ